uniref:Fibronectin type-III domain-containing protein n=1 Tax=Podarcis muralis TaxID=64176 RepID=A0A670ITZ0_PODMU
MMITANILVVLYILFCKICQVVLSHHCSAITEQDTIHCPGKVWTEPASTIQMGQNITINCHSDKDVCQNSKKRMRLNQREVEDRLVSVINKTTVQLQLHNYNISFSTVICYTVCPPEKPQIICGTEFCVGHSPDMPANLTCVVYEYSNNMTCTWDPGKDTQLSTRYNLYLKSFQGEENKTFPANNASGTIPLSQMWKNKTFYVGVYAENHLGTNCSEELYVHLDDLVVPATPIIIQIVDSPLFKTTIHWKKQTAINETYCEERYKEKTGETWQVRKWGADFKREHQTEYNLDAYMEYQFQVRCKLTHAQSFWSKWSESAVHMTPEAEPSSILDVWRFLGPAYPNGSQEVVILIKPFFPKESRGRILGYRVFCENQGEIVDLCKTTETKCQVLVPPAVTTLHVTAHNSKGSSKPANITVNQPPHSFHDFPPPTNMQMDRDEQKGISVVWKPPQPIGKVVLWYIVEWTSADFRHGLVWKKVPIQNTTTFIKENVRMGHNFNISVYAVYQDGTSKACSIPTLPGKTQDTYNGPGNMFAVTNDDGDDGGGVLWGTGFGMFFLFIIILSLIATNIKRVKTAFWSITPKWLFEDYPRMQNSSVIKSLQGENGGITHNSTGLFIDHEDAVVTEVEETLVHKEYKVVDHKEETREVVLDNVNIPEDRLFVGNLDTTEENGYKPQISSPAVLQDSTNEIHSQSPDKKPNTPAFPDSSLIKDFPSPMATIWPIVGTNENTFLFDKISLVLNNSKSGQSNMVSSTDEEPHTPTDNQWKPLLSDEDIQEQTLIPDELLSCLNAVNEDSSDIMSYFPQNVAK